MSGSGRALPGAVPAIVLALLFAACPPAAPTTAAAPLAIGTTERSIAPGERHVYWLEMGRARTLALELDQERIDLELIAGAAGAEPLAIDNPRGEHRPETLTWVARATGRVTVEVRAPEAAPRPGRYRLRAHAPRPADRRDFAAVRGYRWYRAGNAARKEGHSSRALEAFGRSLRHFRDAREEGAQAWVLTKLADLYATDVGKLDRAVAALREAVRLERRLGGGRALSSVLNSLASVAVQADPRANGYEAVELYREAREILKRQRIDDDDHLLRLLLGEASAQDAIGRTHAALELYRRASDLGRAAGRDDRACHALLGSAVVRRRGGDRTGALHDYGACRAIARGRYGELEAKALAGMGSTRLDLDHARMGLGLLLQAEAMGTLARPADVARLQHDLGRAHGRLGRLERARAAFERALESTDDPRHRLLIRIDRAYAHAQAGEHQTAVAICRRVVGDALGGGDPLAVAGAHHCLARNLAATGKRAEALRQIRTAVGRVEELRGHLAQDHLRSLFLASRHEYYELYVQLLLDRAQEAPAGGASLRWLGEAFEVAERSKARTLLDGLSRGDSGLDDEVDLATMARKRELEDEIAGLEILLLTGMGGGEGEGSAHDLDTLAVELDRRRARLDEVRGALRAGRPGWRDALALEPARLEAIRAGLLADGETQIVSYFLGEEASAVWVLGRDSMVVERLPPRRTIERLAAEAAERFAHHYRPHQAVRTESAARALTAAVLDPIVPALTGRRLVLVKEGALVRVPFAALRVGAGRDSAYLSERFEIVQSHSASTALALRRPRRWRPVSNQRIAILADPVFQPDDERLGHGLRQAPAPTGEGGARGDSRPAVDLADLPRLPATGAEARAIAGLAAGREPLLELGFAARADLLLDSGLSSFEIVHLATHGFSRPETAGLVLSRFDPYGREIDGLVREWQVYDLRLAASMVVLSACRTGRGSELTGEGVIGLSRAFLWAGASSVVVSLWEVDDEATAVLMKRFYRELLDRGTAPGEALRRAQAEVRSRAGWSAPRYWAGFVLQGDWR